MILIAKCAWVMGMVGGSVMVFIVAVRFIGRENVFGCDNTMKNKIYHIVGRILK